MVGEHPKDPKNGDPLGRWEDEGGAPKVEHAKRPRDPNQLKPDRDPTPEEEGKDP